jgi:hypothetical protein
MSSRFTRFSGISLLSTLVFCGCMLPLNAPTGEIPIALLHNSYSCETSDEEAKLTVISDQNTYEGLWRRINRSSLMPPSIPGTDFHRYVLVLVELGRRNNAGYGLILSASDATINSGEVTLPVTAITPQSDTLTPQVLVSPCLLVQINRQGVDTVNALGITRQVAPN